MLLWHDVGRLITPTAFLRNDLICNRLMVAVGIPRQLVNQGFSLIELGEAEQSSPEIANRFKKALTVEQNILWLADNLGKLGPHGEFFGLDGYLAYLVTYNQRQAKDEVALKTTSRHNPWPSWNKGIKNRIRAEKLQATVGPDIVRDTIEWLEGLGIDFESITKQFESYGPKFIILANPESAMTLVNQITQRQFRVALIKASPQDRASSQVLSRAFNLPTTFDTQSDQLSLSPTQATTSATLESHQRFQQTITELTSGQTAILLSPSTDTDRHHQEAACVAIIDPAGNLFSTFSLSKTP